MSKRELLSIGELAGLAGINTSALRYYERLGLVEPVERVSGRRRYDAAALDRLRTIAAAKQAGFSLEEVRRLLAGADSGRGAEELRRLAVRKLPEVEALIGRAERIREWLLLAEQCKCGSLDVCELFTADHVTAATPSASASGR